MTTIVAVAVALVLTGLWLRGRRRLHRADRNAELSRQRLERAEEAKEMFFDLVTHELRSPLSAILGYQELLHDGAYGDLPDVAAEPVGRIGRSARHLLHLIDGVVELSRIRSGSVRPDLATVNLGVVFASAAEAFRATARERRIEPRVHMPDSFPAIRSDQDRLVRALDLLVTSAVKHPAGSEITLHLTADQHGATIRLSGLEIEPSDDHDDLALRFGIRLAVADAIARVLGGHLDFESDDQDVIRALSFRVPDRASPPAPDHGPGL